MKVALPKFTSANTCEWFGQLLLQEKSACSRENINQKGSLRHIKKEEGRKKKRRSFNKKMY